MKLLLKTKNGQGAILIREGLVEHGFKVTQCDDAAACVAMFLWEPWCAVVLDIALPGPDGLAVLARLRARNSLTPVIVLRADNQPQDCIEALHLGADDHMASPPIVDELAARLGAVMRRLPVVRNNLVQVQGITLNRITRQVSSRGRKVVLPAREFCLLEYLMRSAGQVLTRQQLLKHVWGRDFDPMSNVVSVTVKRLRDSLAALDPLDASPSPIESCRGAGYRFRRAA